MSNSALTTEQERKLFSELLDKWRENHLATAPREQLEAIEDAMCRYRPVSRLHSCSGVMSLTWLPHPLGIRR